MRMCLLVCNILTMFEVGELITLKNNDYCVHLLGYYESLQDQIASIHDARQAVTALRDDHQRRKQEAMLEEQRRRQLQMHEKLRIMRQRKHVCLFLKVMLNLTVQ